MIGPYTSLKEACEAYAATVNREVPQNKFLDSLHPDVIYATKHERIEGEIRVVFELEARWNWSINDPSPYPFVALVVNRRKADGEPITYCCSFHVDEPTRIQTETYLALRDGWIERISIYSAWLDTYFPFPERVIEAHNRREVSQPARLKKTGPGGFE